MPASSLQEYYARRVAEYEEIYQKPERQASLAALKSRVCSLMAGRDVLELACGTGYWTRVMAPVCRSVVATDAVPETLGFARAQQREGNQVRFVCADAFVLDKLSGSFDGGFAGFWWSHIPQQQLGAFLEGFHHRLQAKAQVCFIDNLYVEGSSTPLAETDESGNTYQRRRLHDGSEHRVIKNFPATSELKAAIAGWAVEVEVVSLEYYWMLHYRLAG